MNENQRHAMAHAKYLCERASPDNPDVCFDYELVQTLLSLIASPPEQPAARPGYREYAALSIVEQAVKDMAGIGGDISGVTCQKMKKLIQTIEPCKRCGGSGWLETVECPNCDNGLVKSIPPGTARRAKVR